MQNDSPNFILVFVVVVVSLESLVSSKNGKKPCIHFYMLTPESLPSLHSIHAANQNFPLGEGSKIKRLVTKSENLG